MTLTANNSHDPNSGVGGLDFGTFVVARNQSGNDFRDMVFLAVFRGRGMDPTLRTKSAAKDPLFLYLSYAAVGVAKNAPKQRHPLPRLL